MTETDMLHAVRGAGVLDVLRVFCGPDGSGGNRLGVIRDGSSVPAVPDRQAIAAGLGAGGTSHALEGSGGETVFVDDPERGVIDTYTPTLRLPFAGYPCVGAAWLLDVPELITPAGVVGARFDGEFTWIEARADWALGVPPRPSRHWGRALRRYGSVAEVDALPAPLPDLPADATPEQRWIYAWAWEDEPAGRVRARGFPGRGDTIDEDEATGAAALALTGLLGRALNIRQGRGSQLLTAPQPEGWIELGGRVALEERGVRVGARPTGA